MSLINQSINSFCWSLFTIMLNVLIEMLLFLLDNMYYFHNKFFELLLRYFAITILIKYIHKLINISK